MSETLRVTYALCPARGEDAETKARDIALEQTAELPGDVLSESIRSHWIGDVVSVTPVDGGSHHAVIDFPAAAAAGELTQLMNLLFGNVSLKPGIRLIDIQWPPELVSVFGGPGLGIDGLRRLTGCRRRALLATVLKPLGSPSKALAASAAAFARGGADIIKDDHGLTNQSPAPFHERLHTCQAAVARGNAASGNNALYFPNVTGAWPALIERATAAQRAGCRGVLVNLALTGLDAAAWLRDELGLAVMAHPALTGGLFGAHSGIGADVLLGDVFRLAGADAVIYPNVGGRFGFSASLCTQINERLRRPLGAAAAAFPTPGGGVDTARVPGWIERYGSDTIFLIGGSLYAAGDLSAATSQLREAMSP